MRKVSRSENNIDVNIKEVMTKESADAGQIAQGIAHGLAVAVPASIAGGAAINKVVDKIIKKKNAPPATGSEEAYNATGFMSPQQVQERREASFEERYASEEDPLAFAHSLQQAPKQNQQQQPMSAPGNIAEEGAAEGAGVGELAGLAAVASKTAGQWGPTPGGDKNCVGMRKGRDKCVGELSKNGYPNKADGGSQCKQCENYDSAHMSSKTAGAWPSETDWEGHLHNLEELLSETQKGVGWHAAKDEKKEMKAHDKLAKDLQKVIDDIKKVMKFPAAKTASVETDDWRDEHSNLDSDW